VLAGVFSGEDGSPMVLLGPVWIGDVHRGEQFMDRLKRLGTPAVSQIAPMGYSDLLSMFNAKAASGLHYALQTRWLADLSPEVISAVIEAGEERTSRLSFVAIHHFHGPGTDIAPDATAFHLRQSHFLMEIGAAWEPDALPGATLHQRWLSEASSRITPHALPGGYPNFLTHRDALQVASAYGENTRRLCRLKRHYDPGNVFSSTTPLPL
jgi:hypothetical protein